MILGDRHFEPPRRLVKIGYAEQAGAEHVADPRLRLGVAGLGKRQQRIQRGRVIALGECRLRVRQPRRGIALLACQRGLPNHQVRHDRHSYCDRN